MFSGTDILLYTAFGSAARRCGGCIAGSLYSSVQHWEQFRCESSLSTWIYRIATNESLRLLNSRKRRETVSTEDIQESLISRLKASDYVDYENELAVKFQEAILRLPEKQRLIFNLRYYDELDYEEIARILDGKADTLKVNYHYAKEKIKEYILNN